MEAYSLFMKIQKVLPEFFNLEPETLKEQFKLSDLDLEKLFACQTVFHNHLPFISWQVFEKVACVFNNDPSDFYHMQSLTPAEITWAVRTMRLIDNVTHFNEEVIAYMAFICHREGLLTVPTELSFEKGDQGMGVQYFLDDMNVSKELTPEAKKVQADMLKSIKDYVDAKAAKVKEELGMAHVK
jgi:hypothetical protein